MPVPTILVFGSSGHAGVAIDIIEKQNIWKIAGLIDPFAVTGRGVMGYEVFGAEIFLPELVAQTGVATGIVAVGDNFVRSRFHVPVRRVNRYVRERVS